MSLTMSRFVAAAALIATLIASDVQALSVNLPHNGVARATTAVVGYVYADGGVWLMAHKFGFAGSTNPEDCVYTFLGWGGLQENTTIFGGQYADTIQTASSLVVVNDPVHHYCGWELGPVPTNGYTLGIVGNGGNDTLSCGPELSTYLAGGPGNDWVIAYCSSTNYPGYGGDGDDSLWANIYGRLDGEAGNDRFTPAVRHDGMRRVNGGSGTDRFCDDGAVTYSSSLEIRDASCYAKPIQSYYL